MGDAKQVLGVAPYLIVEDLEKSANWYRDALGFKYHRFWGEPPCFVMVTRDNVTLMLKSLPGVEVPASLGPRMRPNRLLNEDACWDMYVWVKDSQALYEEYKAKGVKIRREIENSFYGCRDFDIEDCNGYVLCFGQDLEG